MTNEEIQRSVEAFDKALPDGEPKVFHQLRFGDKFRHPKATKHKLIKIVFSCETYIQYAKEDDWIKRIKPEDELWNTIVQTFK